MRSFKFTQTNSEPYSGLNGTVIIGDGSSGILLLSVDGVGAPPLAVQSQRAPFQHGQSVIRNLFEPRTVTLECAITIPGTSAANVAAITAKKREISHLFSPVGMGYFANTASAASDYSTFLGKLSYASDGVTFDRHIDAVPLTVEFPNKFYSDGFQRFRVVFLCPDPFWYGETFTQTMDVPQPIPAGTYGDPAYSDLLGATVVIDTATGKVWRSYDGLNFTNTATLPTSGGNALWDATRALYFTFDASGVYSSPDAVTWTLRDATASGNGMANPGYVLAFAPEGTYSASYRYSADGTTWATGTLPAAIRVTSAAYAEGINVMVVVGYDAGAVNRTYYSYDGTFWASGTFSATGAAPTDVIFAESASKFVCFFGSTMETSDNGITWGAPVALGGTYAKPAWSNSLGILMASAASSSGLSLIWSTNLTSFTTVSYVFPNYGPTLFLKNTGIFISFPTGGGAFPTMGYDGKSVYALSTNASGSVLVSPLTILAGTSITTGGPVAVGSGLTVTIQSTGVWSITAVASDYAKEITNDGDAQIDFKIKVPIYGNEVGTKVIISDNFIWDGTGTPPSDRNIVVSTDGLPPGFVEINTAFGSKDIKQFGNSIIEKFITGTFFNLYVSGQVTNFLYVRNTGLTVGAPVVTWRKKYVGV